MSPEMPEEKMTDFLFQFAFSNVFLSLCLAAAALAVGKAAGRPRLAHILWLLVFIKLMTPPVLTVPVAKIPVYPGAAYVSISTAQPELPLAGNFAERWYAALDYRKKELSIVWLLGSLVILIISLARIFRFSLLLKDGTESAPEELQKTAAEIASRLGMRSVPAVCITQACLPPIVWWAGGKVRIIIPVSLYRRMDPGQFRWILAHELAHVRRRDYLVRWIEWLACVCFWWNPVAWWARHNLRENEELCCDAMVITGMNLKPRTYADSLLKAVQFLAGPAKYSPALASGIFSGGFLVRRFKMIISDRLYRPNPRWLQVSVLLCALIALPLSFAGQEDKAKNEWAVQNKLAGITTEDPAAEAEINNYQEGYKKKLQGYIDAGEITLKEAKYKNAEFNKGLMKNQFLHNLQKAVGEGTLTEEQADKKLAGFKKKFPKEKWKSERKSTGKKIDWDTASRKIENAVKNGTITREQAGEKYRYLKRAAEKDKNKLK